MNKQGSSAGQSLVELSLSFLALLLLLGGAVDLGRAFFGFVAIRDAAQEGASYAALKPGLITNTATIKTDFDGSAGYDTKLKDRIRNSSDKPLNLNDIQNILIDASQDCVKKSVTVSVTYRFRTIMPLMSVFVDKDKGYVPIPAIVVQTMLSTSCTNVK